MGLFSFFNKKNGHTENYSSFGGTEIQKPLDVTKDKFIAEETSNNNSVDNGGELPERNITLLFQFLDQNHEAKGYDDALMNPDASHLDQNLQILKNDLQRTVKKVKTFYEDFISEINFHIETRSKGGMVDTVDELKMKKEIAQSHINKILQIEEDAKNSRGDSQGVLMSYTRGFKNGLAAISHHSILKRKI